MLVILSGRFCLVPAGFFLFSEMFSFSFDNQFFYYICSAYFWAILWGFLPVDLTGFFYAIFFFFVSFFQRFCSGLALQAYFSIMQ